MSFWVKGNIHTHTTESDGDADPKSVMKWYKDHEYDFLVITDHNHRTIIDFDNNNPQPEKELVLIPGEEVTAHVLEDFAKNILNYGVEGKIPIHINGIEYHYDETKNKTKKKFNFKISKFIFTSINKSSNKNLEKYFLQGKAIANGIKFAKKLGDLPSNICTPTYLAKSATSLGKTNKKLNIKIHSEKEMKSMGMNCLLSVGNGSNEPSKLITIKYSGANSKDKPIVLVGKGITFDTGGISIKPSSSMDEMKYDMCGAASVLGTMKTISELNLKLNVVGVIAAAENMPSGSDRAIGFDTPSQNGKSSAGDYFGDKSFGHLGFTGTSVWADPDQEIIIVFLTNRVHPTRENKGIYQARRIIYNSVMKQLILK